MRHHRPPVVEDTRFVEWSNCTSPSSPAGPGNSWSDSWSLPRDASVLSPDREFHTDPSNHTFDAIDLSDGAQPQQVERQGSSSGTSSSRFESCSSFSDSGAASSAAQEDDRPRRKEGSRCFRPNGWNLSRLGSLVEYGASNSFKKKSVDGSDIEGNTVETTTTTCRHRNTWLRPAILGACEGMVITATVLMGVAAVVPSAPMGLLLVCALGGLVAGASSLAIGEFISVSSQRDANWAMIKEQDDFLIEHGDLEDGGSDVSSMTRWYVNKGLSSSLAKRVAKELSQREGADMVAEEKMGVSANPWGAACTSAIAFCVGALIPLLAVVFIGSRAWRLGVLLSTCGLAFASLGAFGAFMGGSPMVKSTVRVTLCGVLAIGICYGLLRLLTASYTISFAHDTSITD